MDPDAEGSAAASADVTLTRVIRGDIRETVAISGSVAALPNQDVKVSAFVPGRVAELTVAEGDPVRAGQVLARLDARPYQEQLQQAEAAVQSAKANLGNAQASRKRNEDLFQRGIAARKDLEDSRTQENVTAASLRQAEGALGLARLQLERTQIHSPLSGRVARRFVSVGEQVDGTAAQPVVEVANLDQVELLGNLPAVYLAKLHAGESFEIESDAFPGKHFTGRVVAISPSVDPATNLGLVRIGIANPNGSLRIGMFLSAQVSIEDHKNALIVPPEAIYRDENSQPRVYRVAQGKAATVGVKLGIQTKESVELLSGVKEGDAVILNGGYGLADGAKVRVKP
jgi:RND family efflux transporter MFP subunit